jgi:hypothetical protein
MLKSLDLCGSPSRLRSKGVLECIAEDKMQICSLEIYVVCVCKIIYHHLLLSLFIAGLFSLPSSERMNNKHNFEDILCIGPIIGL